MYTDSFEWNMNHDRIMNTPVARDFFMAGEPQKTYDDYCKLTETVHISVDEYLNVLRWTRLTVQQ